MADKDADDKWEEYALYEIAMAAQLGNIIIIIINEEIIVAFSPKTTRTRYKVKKQNCEIRREYREKQLQYSIWVGLLDR